MKLDESYDPDRMSFCREFPDICKDDHPCLLKQKLFVKL